MKTVNQLFLEYVNENYGSLIEFFEELDNEEIENVKKMLEEYAQTELDKLVEKNIESGEIQDRDDLERLVCWFIENIEGHELGMGEMSDVSEIVDDIIYRSDKLSEDENGDLFIG